MSSCVVGCQSNNRPKNIICFLFAVLSCSKVLDVYPCCSLVMFGFSIEWDSLGVFELFPSPVKDLVKSSNILLNL